MKIGKLEINGWEFLIAAIILTFLVQTCADTVVSIYGNTPEDETSP